MFKIQGELSSDFGILSSNLLLYQHPASWCTRSSVRIRRDRLKRFEQNHFFSLSQTLIFSHSLQSLPPFLVFLSHVRFWTCGVVSRVRVYKILALEECRGVEATSLGVLSNVPPHHCTTSYLLLEKSHSNKQWAYFQMYNHQGWSITRSSYYQQPQYLKLI